MDYVRLKTVLALSREIDSSDRDFTSTIRGIWGRSLKKMFCFQRNIECSNCSFNKCTYNTLFNMKFSDREHFHPYIIRDVRGIKRHSSEIQVEFTLFGFITQHMDKVIPSIIEMSRFPIIFEGKKISFYTERIVDQSGKLVFDQKKHIICHPSIFSMELTPEISNRVKMRFDTPLRIKYNNMFMRSFLFDPIILSLYRRLVYLNEHFNNSELKLTQYEINDQIVISNSQFKWEERPRKSLIKDQVMSLGGLLGEVELSNIDPYTYQLLKLGEIVQVGKQTSFGLGKYTIENFER